jgi:hypothetical protein
MNLEIDDAVVAFSAGIRPFRERGLNSRAVRFAGDRS